MSDAYLSNGNIDDLGRMVMALVSELWITRDRLAALETMLDAKGVVAAGALDNFVPSAAQASMLEAMRDRLVASVLGAPVAAQERSVNEILRRAGHSPLVDGRPGSALDPLKAVS